MLHRILTIASMSLSDSELNSTSNMFLPINEIFFRTSGPITKWIQFKHLHANIFDFDIENLSVNWIQRIQLFTVSLKWWNNQHIIE